MVSALLHLSTILLWIQIDNVVWDNNFVGYKEDRVISIILESVVASNEKQRPKQYSI